MIECRTYKQRNVVNFNELNMELIKVVNNISERVIDDLKTKLSKRSRVSIAAASFSERRGSGVEEEGC